MIFYQYFKAGLLFVLRLFYVFTLSQFVYFGVSFESCRCQVYSSRNSMKITTLLDCSCDLAITSGVSSAFEVYFQLSTAGLANYFEQFSVFKIAHYCYPFILES